MFATTSSFVFWRLYNATTFELKMSFNVIAFSMCFVYKIRLASFSCLCLSCVRFMFKYLALCCFFPFLIRRRLSFLKTFLVYHIYVSYFKDTMGRLWI